MNWINGIKKSTYRFIFTAIFRLFFILLWMNPLGLQGQSDSSKVLETVNISEGTIKKSIERQPDVVGTYIYAGKKNEVINLQGLNANLAEKNARQVFAQVPGIFVYDMDGSGNQVNIASRGLDPHRGWEFNIRQNGILTNTDMYGYPASHYVVPFEALEKIELLRGTGSLQYGAQFGGMLNYVTREADSSRKLGGRFVQSVGSFNMSSTFISVGGRIGKWQYDGYYNRRTSNGYRQNSNSKASASMFQLTYFASKKVKIKIQSGNSDYLYQMPGPLTDSMFLANPKASSRSRNYYRPNIFIPAISLNWNPSINTSIFWNISAVLGQRSSVMFDKPANLVDKIDPATMQYASRQVDIDQYHSYTSEMRVLHKYKLRKLKGQIATGFQLMRNDLHRMQQGKGSTASDWNIALQPGTSWGRDMHLLSKNIALFAENRIEISEKFSICTGIRYENGGSKLNGKIAYLPAEQVPINIVHKFPLLGASAQYGIAKNSNFYAGWSQAYRPIIFKDIIPVSIYEKVAPGLKDAYGYNGEIGFRGSSTHWKWDVSAFQLLYKNRMGTIAQIDTAGKYIVVHTNIGNSRCYGAEIFVQFNQHFSKYFLISIFTSTSLMNATYIKGIVKQGNENKSIVGNKVESAPAYISRNGISFVYKKISGTFLYSYTAKTYADALNSLAPDAAGAVGVVPSYSLMDLNLACQFTKSISCKLSINNLSNKSYFTKRPQFYPGPGVWSSDGRSLLGSITMLF